MALSLDDIKNSKAKRVSKKTSKLKKKASANSKTKPWEKPHETIEVSFKKLNIEDSDIFKKAVDWSKKIKLFPKIDIPVPDFLLTREDD